MSQTPPVATTGLPADLDHHVSTGANTGDEPGASAAEPRPGEGAGPSSTTPALDDEQGRVGEWGSSGPVMSDAVVQLARAAQADNTRRGYAADWAHFTAWTTREGLQAMPAEPGVVAEYVADLAATRRPDGRWAYTPATVARRVAGLNFVHRRAGHPTPGSAEIVRAALAGLRRTRATPPRRMHALRLATLVDVLATVESRSWPQAVIGRRDTALLLLGWATALRRSELAALRREDLTAHPVDGLHVLIRTSKTDPDAAGATLAVPFGTTPATCAACALTAWTQILYAWDGYRYSRDQLTGRAAVLRLLLTDPPTDAADTDRHRCHHPTSRTTRSTATDPQSPDGWGEGPLFRPVTKATTIGDRALGGDAVHHVLRRRLAAAGISPDGYGAHSLRAGFVTDAYRAGASTHAITRQTRHRNPATVAGYARHYTPLESNAVTQVGL